MIIVSQNEEDIINFNNVTSISLAYEYNQKSRIIYKDVEGEIGILGTYATEERAKEVLNEIIEQATRQRGVLKIEKMLTDENKKILTDKFKEKFEIVDNGLDFIPYGNVIEKYEMPEK